MPLDPRTPVLVGYGQVNQHDEHPEVEPVDLMVAAARAAADPRVLEAVDSVRIVNLLSWRYRDAGLLLAQRIGAPDAETRYTGVGGNVPQSLVNQACLDIQAGRADAVLIAGGETWRTLYRFDLTPHLHADYEPLNWFAATHPTSPFPAHLMAARAEPHRHLALSNTRFTVREQGRPHSVRVGFPPTGRTLNIGEQKRHNPRRRHSRGHPHRMSHKALFKTAIETDYRDSRNSSISRRATSGAGS